MSRLIKDPTDQHVGQRLRQRRQALGMSQDKLAQAVGVSFQQVQKYENGTNRMGAGRLKQVATALEVPLTYFFDQDHAPLLKVAEDIPLTEDILGSKESVEVLTGYYSLDSEQRAEVIALIDRLRS